MRRELKIRVVLQRKPLFQLSHVWKRDEDLNSGYGSECLKVTDISVQVLEIPAVQLQSNNCWCCCANSLSTLVLEDLGVDRSYLIVQLAITFFYLFFRPWNDYTHQ